MGTIDRELTKIFNTVCSALCQVVGEIRWAFEVFHQCLSGTRQPFQQGLLECKQSLVRKYVYHF